MFGHRDDDTTQNDQASATNEPNDDGMLSSLPLPDSNEPMILPASDVTTTGATPSPSFRQSSPSVDDNTDTTGTADDLISIKQEALQHLKPLVGHLEQNPEEKFRTTMMMIQASDDQALIPEAFAAAKAITDDKARAQALLDVVNEINYFTTQHNNAA